jgi:sigma-B regulation protein RsbU (phosphoserine phosphatase)
MNQRRLYHTIEKLASQHYAAPEELLTHVVEDVVRNEQMSINGGRIWKLTDSAKSYKLIHQVGNVEDIPPGFRIKVAHYPIFVDIGKRKTVLANETNTFLRGKGIVKYSATGIGNHIKSPYGRLYQYVLAFNAEELDERLLYTLNIIGNAVTSVLRQQKAEERTKVLERDLVKAWEIQKNILPDHEYLFHNYEIFGVSVPEQVVGGDFFDYIAVGEDSDRVGIAIGDATSKGLAAAVLALYVSGALKMGAWYQTKLSSLIKRVSDLVDATFPDDRFVTLFYAELLNTKNGLCIYANAGHNSPIFFSAETGRAELLEATGPALGLSPNQKYTTENINMKQGDILLCYTDGITEAMNSDFQPFGEERLINKLIECRNLSAKEITETILETVQQYSAQGTYSDDKTIVAIKRVR